MSRLRGLTVLSVIIVLISGLIVFEVYNSWQNREVYFQESPYYVIRNIAHILKTGDYLVITYKEYSFLVEERFEADEYLWIEEEFTDQPDTYVEFFHGYRKPMLWFHDSESEPRVTKIIVHYGSRGNKY